MKHATEMGTGSPSPALQKIMVTGGTGYLAANLIDLLKNNNCHIVRLGRPATVFTPMAGVARDFVADSSCFFQATGWKGGVSLIDGIDRTIDCWLTENGAKR